MNQITYGDLFAYLRDHKQTLRTANPHYLVKRFLSLHLLPHSRIIEVLEGFGGYDDEEVLWNAAIRIPSDTGLLEDVETPVEYAIRQELYVYNGNSGWEEPDINSALAMMMEERHG